MQELLLCICRNCGLLSIHKIKNLTGKGQISREVLAIRHIIVMCLHSMICQFPRHAQGCFSGIRGICSAMDHQHRYFIHQIFKGIVSSDNWACTDNDAGDCIGVFGRKMKG